MLTGGLAPTDQYRVLSMRLLQSEISRLQRPLRHALVEVLTMCHAFLASCSWSRSQRFYADPLHATVPARMIERNTGFPYS
jgi:hypothetical protein